MLSIHDVTTLMVVRHGSLLELVAEPGVAMYILLFCVMLSCQPH